MTTPFERRCRRLLRWYPAEHRRDHGAEMIGVLLDSATPGQLRPSRREALAMVVGGTRVRLRHAFGASAAAWWRDAFAVVAAIVAVLMAVQALPTLLTVPAFLFLDQEASGLPGRNVLWYCAALAAAALLVWSMLGNRRRVAIVAAWVAAMIQVFNVIPLVANPAGFTAAPFIAGEVYLAGLVVVGVMLTGEPRRGFEIVGRRLWIWAAGLVVVLSGTALLSISGLGTRVRVPSPWNPVETFGVSLLHDGGRAAIVLLVTAVAAALAVPSPVGRRTLALMAVPALVFVLSLQALYTPLTRLTISVLAGLVFAVTLRRRSSPRRSPVDEPDGVEI